MAIEIITWSISTKVTWRGWGSNSWLLDLQSDMLPSALWNCPAEFEMQEPKKWWSFWSCPWEIMKWREVRWDGEAGRGSGGGCNCLILYIFHNLNEKFHSRNALQCPTPTLFQFSIPTFQPINYTIPPALLWLDWTVEVNLHSPGDV